MAFTDSPEVDESSTRSEESVALVKSILSRRNGFINREETPDYGVDLDVELVSNGKNASSQKFAVQIKCVTKLAIVKKKQESFISFTFETSRLSYLCRRVPGYGIIVLYHDAGEKKVAYYDYVVDIMRRVEALSPKLNWQDQESVQIYIPPTRIFDISAAAEIHDTVTGLYARHNLLLRSHAARYNIPFFETATATEAFPKVDFHNATQVAQLLREYGGLLFNDQQYAVLIKLLESLPSSTVGGSAPLSFLAALTYGQTGYLTEGDYFLAKARRLRGELDNESLALLEFTQIRLNFLRGELDLPAYTDRMNALAATSSNELNALMLRINAYYLAAISFEFNQAQDFDIASVEALFDQVDTATLDEDDKVLLRLYNADTLQIYASKLFLHQGLHYKLQEMAGIGAPIAEKAASMKRLFAWLERASRYAYAAHEYGAEHENNRLLASAKHYISRFFLSLEFDKMMLSIDQEPVLLPEVDQQFGKHLTLAGEAYNLFNEATLRKDAHLALGTIYDLQTLYLLLYKRNLGTKPLDETMKLLRGIEQEIDIPPFESVIEKAYHGLTETLNSAGDTWAAISDEDVEAYARTIARTYNIPLDRLPNVIADVQNHHRFQAACQHQEVVMLQDNSHMDNPETAYAEIPNYILRNQITGVETLPFKDVREVLIHLDTHLRTQPNQDPDNEDI